jgi:hypothetical protein
MRAGKTETEMAEAVIDAAATQGLTGESVRKDFADAEAGAYEPDAVPAFRRALNSATAVFEAHRATLDPFELGPVQFWPHGFDLAFEWFGTKTTEAEGATYPSQVNLGFYSSGDPYFNSNPFPFDGATLTEGVLPHGEWCSDAFEGSALQYSDVADRPDGSEIVSACAKAVYEVARPTLTA